MSEWALITGASVGIGRELAKCAAANGMNVVLTARDERRLKGVAQEIAAQFRVEALVLTADLTEPTAPRNLFERLRDKPVSQLINNAGFGGHGAFAKGDLAAALQMMHVNMDALVDLTHRFLQPMLARRNGGILNVASTAAFQPGPFMNIYYATKAFVHSFSCALAEELSGTGVTVTALCPGPTRTEFQSRAGMKREVRWLRPMSAEAVARAGYLGLLKRKRVVIPGVMNKVTSALARRAPTTLTTKAVRKINEERG